MVDLGLPSGLLWAKCNVGATSEEEYGLYFQWGDTVGYTGDDALAHSYWSTTPFNGGNANYDSSAINQAIADSKIDATSGIIAPQYDAATVHMGSQYHMPTSGDLQELIAQTNHEVAEINGVKGMKYINKNDANKYIFIPFAGDFDKGQFYGGGESGSIWGSSLYMGNLRGDVAYLYCSVIGSTGADVDGRSNGCMYQFGRKDPMLRYPDVDPDSRAAVGEMKREHGYYGNGSLKNSIQNPDVFYFGSYHSGCGNWGRFTHYNLWTGKYSGTDYSVNDESMLIKTIYDPSPRGYKVPPSIAFSSFKRASNKAVRGIIGWSLYTLSNKEDVIFFPATGFRELETADILEYKRGGYWSSVPSPSVRVLQRDFSYGLSWAINEANPITNGDFMRSIAACVRPVKE